MNWKQLLTDLKIAGFRQEQIAQACDCSQTTISELATGKTANPSYPIGMALTALHKKRVRRFSATASPTEAA